MNVKEKFPHASRQFLEINGQLSSPKPQLNAPVALGKTTKRSRKIRGRTRVCYRAFFVRPLDPDNLAAGTKQITDCLTAIGLISSDDPYNLSISWEQEKVVHFNDEKLEIEITKWKTKITPQ